MGQPDPQQEGQWPVLPYTGNFSQGCAVGTIEALRIQDGRILVRIMAEKVTYEQLPSMVLGWMVVNSLRPFIKGGHFSGMVGREREYLVELLLEDSSPDQLIDQLSKELDQQFIQAASTRK